VRLDLSTRTRWLHATALTLGFAVVYFLAYAAIDRVGFSSGWTILWPLNGITVAVLIALPRSDWAAVLLGIELGIGTGEFHLGTTFSATVAQRSISLLEVVLSALLLPPFSTLNDWLRQPRVFSRFVAALVLGPGISGVIAAVYYHYAMGQGYLLAFNNWATADALGIAAVMPVALAVRSTEMRDLFRGRKILATVGTLALGFVCAHFVFSVSRYPLVCLLFPMLLLIDYLLGFAGAAIAALVISVYGVVLATRGVGPFGHWSADLAIPRDLGLQLYLGFNLVGLFPVSILALERRRMAAELRETNAQLLRLASLDGLTNVPNRRSLDERFLQEWNAATRSQTPLALLMIDIDNFKQFNDLYGHQGGDRCLQAVAAAFAGELHRAQDHLSRFGGEEFAVLLPQTDEPGAVFIAEKLRAVVSALAIEHRGSSWTHVTISVGCAAVTPAPGEESVALLEMADVALYQAKRGGRNQVFAAHFHPARLHYFPHPNMLGSAAPMASNILYVEDQFLG
jgi:diguanylate cyclase (GGDEF)-like protein